MRLNDTMSRLWHSQAALHGKASRLRQAGEHQAAGELDTAAYRLGNQLLEVEAVVQQYDEQLALCDEPADRDQVNA